MANIRAVMGRHDWIEGYREERFTKRKREVVKCRNCAKTHDFAHGDPPVTGCFSDIKLGNLGTSMQQDQLERDMRGGLYS